MTIEEKLANYLKSYSTEEYGLIEVKLVRQTLDLLVSLWHDVERLSCDKVEIEKITAEKIHKKAIELYNEPCAPAVSYNDLLTWLTTKYNIGGENMKDVNELMNEIKEQCGDCEAWSGTDCTRNPYTQGCLKDEKKLTDEEIVKDIERSTGMPSYWKKIVLDLIHRLQDENAGLKERGEVVINNLHETIDKQASDIERLKNDME